MSSLEDKCQSTSHLTTGPALSPRRVVVIVYPNSRLIDVAGPLEVFLLANDVINLDDLKSRLYSYETAALTLDAIAMSPGLYLVPACKLDSLDETVDTILVAGGPGWAEASRDAAFIRQLSVAFRSARRHGAIAKDILPKVYDQMGGRPATTDVNSVFEREGHAKWSLGSSAGICLALSLIEVDHGSDLALKVAQRLALPLWRPGVQEMQSAGCEISATLPAIQRVRTWAAQNPATSLSTGILAEQAGMSVRNFNRAFKRATGETPAVFVARTRIDQAQLLLEQTSLPIKVVVERCGFKSADSLRRVFLDKVGITPAAYRRVKRTS